MKSSYPIYFSAFRSTKNEGMPKKLFKWFLELIIENAAEEAMETAVENVKNWGKTYDISKLNKSTSKLLIVNYMVEKRHNFPKYLVPCSFVYRFISC